MKPPPPAPTRPSVLVLIHDAATRAQVLEWLAPLAPAVTVDHPAEAEERLREETHGVLIVEDELPEETGLMFLARINDRHPWLRRILICRHLEPDLFVFLINEANVFRCLTLPIAPDTFRKVVAETLAEHARARELAASAAETERLRAELARPGARLRRLSTAARHWLVSLPKIFLFSLLGALWVFGLGAAVLLALYLLKTILGIDLIEGLHLLDLFR